MLVYEAIRNKLPNVYTNVFYQFTRDDQIGDVGIYLYEGQNDLYSIDGEEVYAPIKAHIQVNAGKSIDEINKALDYLEEFVNRIENEQSGISGISFISVKHLGPKAIPIGRNKFDINIVKTDLELYLGR